MIKMITTDVVISVNDLVQEFAREGNDYQAAFFNAVGLCFKEAEWPANLQLDAIVKLLDDDGKYLIITLADRMKGGEPESK